MKPEQVVGLYKTLFDANLVKATLNDAGIRAAVLNENYGQRDGAWWPSDGVALVVLDPTDIEKAKAIIEESQSR